MAARMQVWLPAAENGVRQRAEQRCLEVRTRPDPDSHAIFFPATDKGGLEMWAAA